MKLVFSCSRSFIIKGNSFAGMIEHFGCCFELFLGGHLWLFRLEFFDFKGNRNLLYKKEGYQ